MQAKFSTMKYYRGRPLMVYTLYRRTSVKKQQDFLKKVHPHWIDPTLQAWLYSYTERGLIPFFTRSYVGPKATVISYDVAKVTVAHP